MSDTMKIEDYLAAGGVLSSPENAPPRYRAELLRMMASFVDSELAAAAGFADMINAAPGIKSRIAAAKIVLEKTDNAGKVLKVMGDFGANSARYANHHPWTERLPREADLGAGRTGSDMRLSVFRYPLAGWADSVVMNFLMGLAAGIQLEELARVSYQPLAETYRGIRGIEANHTKLAREGMAELDREAAADSVAYWWPRVAESFGQIQSDRAAALSAFGLRHSDNNAMRTRWEGEAQAELKKFGLSAP